MKPHAQEAYNVGYFTETHLNYFTHPSMMLYERIASCIDKEPDPKSLIDVGCGTGSLLQFLKWRTPTVALTGTDIAVPVASDFEFIKGDIASLPLERKFSVVVTLGTIEHIADVKGFVRRLKSLSQPRALIIVMTLNEDSTLYHAARVLNSLGVTLPFNRLYSSHHYHHFTKRSLTRLFEAEGITIEERLLYDPSIKAVDIPASGAMVRGTLTAAVAGLFLLGSTLGRTYLQTLFMRTNL